MQTYVSKSISYNVSANGSGIGFNICVAAAFAGRDTLKTPVIDARTAAPVTLPD